MRLYTILNSTQQRYAHQINNDVTHHVTHSSCQTRTTRKKFPIKSQRRIHVTRIGFEIWIATIHLHLLIYIYNEPATDVLHSVREARHRQARRSSRQSRGWTTVRRHLESNIRLWRQQKERLEKMPRAKKNNRGRPPVFSGDVVEADGVDR